MSFCRYTWCNQDLGNSVITLSADDKDYDITKVSIPTLWSSIYVQCTCTVTYIIFKMIVSVSWS